MKSWKVLVYKFETTDKDVDADRWIITLNLRTCNVENHHFGDDNLV